MTGAELRRMNNDQRRKKRAREKEKGITDIHKLHLKDTAACLNGQSLSDIPLPTDHCKVCLLCGGLCLEYIEISFFSIMQALLIKI